jgi:hypothetical protein
MEGDTGTAVRRIYSEVYTGTNVRRTCIEE